MHANSMDRILENSGSHLGEGTNVVVADVLEKEGRTLADALGNVGSITTTGCGLE